MDNNIPLSFDDVESELPTRTAIFEFAQAWARKSIEIEAENRNLKAENHTLKWRSIRWKVYFCLWPTGYFLYLFFR